MPHLDPEELSLLALYGWEDADSREHLRICPSCASDYAALRRTVDAVRTTPDTSNLSTPGPQVWAGIHRELGLSPSLQEDPLAAVRQDAAGPVNGAVRAARPDDGAARAAAPEAESPGPVPPSDAAHARVYPLKNRGWWQRTGTWMAAAAAAVLVAVGGI